MQPGLQQFNKQGNASVPFLISKVQSLYHIIIIPTYFFLMQLQPEAQMKEYRVREDLPDNFLIGNLFADLNLTTMALNVTLKVPVMKFKLATPLGEMPLVHIEEGTGDIRTTNVSFDRERLCPGIIDDTPCIYEVQVAVLPDEIFELIKLRFLVEDVNDNTPTFSLPIFNITVPENSLIGTRFPVPEAYDADVGVNGIQNYSLVVDQNIFRIVTHKEPTGQTVPELIVLKELDREQKEIYTLKVKAEDGGSPPRSSTAILQVVIVDVNDNRPVFTEENITVSIPEDAPVGSSVAQLHATDADIGDNAAIRFFFTALLPKPTRRLFDLNSTSGLITVREPLDREASASHTLTVWASDGSLKSSSSAVVVVNLTDVNDNPPKINVGYIANISNGSVVLSEKSPVSTKIAVVTVSDKDEGKNGRVVCYMNQNVPFRLRQLYADQFIVETTAPLDFESTKEYTVELTATDAGYPSLNQSSTLLIKVRDENDNAPVFSKNFITTSIFENNRPGSRVTKVTATDADTGSNGEISYLLDTNAPEFDLDSRTGMLTAVTRLDREKQEKYYLSVLAKDNGEPPLITNATVIVRVLDQNDNAPVFSQNEYNFYVPENIPGYGTVGLINVSDPDAGDNSVVTLSIVDAKDEFTIDPQSGVIRPTIPFDREKQESYTFYVKAQDGGRIGQSSTAKVTINVVDVNDNAPVFIEPPSNDSFQLVPLSTDPGTVVYTVYAVDNDTGRNAQLFYSIVEGNDGGLFEINKTTGDITMKKKSTPKDRGLHRLVVKAKDLGRPHPLSSSVAVNLFVNESLTNRDLVHDLVIKKTETPVTSDIDIAGGPSPPYDHANVLITSAVAGTAVIFVIVIIVVVRYYLLAARKNRQDSEWATPNPESRQMAVMKKKQKKQQQPSKKLQFHVVDLDDVNSDDADDDVQSATIDIPTELEEESTHRYDWSTTATTFKPDSPDLAGHYKSTSPQPAFQIQPETPLSSKHHFIQELPLDNTFVAYDSASKCSSSSSDPYSVSECSFPLTTFRDPVSAHARPPMKDVVKARAPKKETTTTVEVTVHPEPQQRSEEKKAGKSQRRVTFHLPEGPQESGSDLDLAELGAVGGAHALPPRYRRGEDFYRAVPSSRTEGDGHSDPECTAEVTVQPTVQEETCTPECLILGHSDACWMPRASPVCTQAAVPHYSPPMSPTYALRHHRHRRSPPAAQFMAVTHSPPPPQAFPSQLSPQLPASALHGSPPPGPAAAESAEGIALKTFPARQARAPRGDDTPMREHPV